MVDQIIRPADLPTERVAPNASEWLVVDNDVTVAKSTIENVVHAGRPAASQAEAETGLNSVKAMTPLTTKQSIASEIGVTIASKAQGDKADTAVQSVVQGSNVTVDNTDPRNPVISAQSGLPAIASGDAGKILTVKQDESGAEWDDAISSVTVDDRTALSLLPTAVGNVYLTEAELFGWFKWSGSNLSSSVSVDTVAGVFVPPASDTSGSSGAWVRQFTGPVQGKWYGNNLQVACNVAFLLSRDMFLGLRGDTYTITSGITIPNILVYSNLFGGSGAKIVASNAAYTAITMGAGARLIGVEVEGPGNATYNAASFGVVASGTNNAPAAPTYADRITIQNCYIHHFGNACIEFRYVSNGSVSHNLVTNAGYAGIANISVLDCDFFQNRIRDIGPGESANAYGIFVSRNNGSYTAFPQSQRVTVRYCHVSGMALWHAFDTHGGIDVTFSDCISEDSPRGFIITSTGDPTNGFRAPIRCKIIGCKAFGKATRALRDQGFWVVGAWNGSAYAQYAENCEIVDSYFFQHGTDTTDARRACGFLGGTRNLVIRNLTIDQASGHGIQFEIENVDYSINGLNLIDWNSNFSSSIGMLYSGNGNRGRIVDFKLLRNNTGLATNVSSIGLYSGAGLTGFQLSTIAPRNLAVTPTSFSTVPTTYDV